MFMRHAGTGYFLAGNSGFSSWSQMLFDVSLTNGEPVLVSLVLKNQ
jgi:hypothetical protein